MTDDYSDVSRRQEALDAMERYGPEARAVYVSELLADPVWHVETLERLYMQRLILDLSVAIAASDYGKIGDAIAAFRNGLTDAAKHQAKDDPDGKVRQYVDALWLEDDE